MYFHKDLSNGFSILKRRGPLGETQWSESPQSFGFEGWVC